MKTEVSLFDLVTARDYMKSEINSLLQRTGGITDDATIRELMNGCTEDELRKCFALRDNYVHLQEHLPIVQDELDLRLNSIVKLITEQ